MKYLLMPTKVITGKSELLLENESPTRTTRIRGYGLGVTFSSRCFNWIQNFSSNQDFIKFSEPAVSF